MRHLLFISGICVALLSTGSPAEAKTAVPTPTDPQIGYSAA
jgi:hypothetical protein